jgi:hypothetical protein
MIRFHSTIVVGVFMYLLCTLESRERALLRERINYITCKNVVKKVMTTCYIDVPSITAYVHTHSVLCPSLPLSLEREREERK